MKIQEIDGNTETIKIVQHDAENLAIDNGEYNKQHGVKYSRERAKNQLLEEQKFEAEKVLSQQTRLLEETKSSLESLTSKKLSLEENIESAKLELQAEMKNFEKMLTDAQSLQVSIPQLEQNKDQISCRFRTRNGIRKFVFKLSSYEKTTIQLKIIMSLPLMRFSKIRHLEIGLKERYVTACSFSDLVAFWVFQLGKNMEFLKTNFLHLHR